MAICKFLLGLLLPVLTWQTLQAQLFYNAGADVAVTGGGVLWIDGATENADGLFSNAGQTTIRGYFRNGSLATGGFANGEYIVYGDWENNNTFTADQSIVRLVGNSQLITGTSVTTYHDLSLETSGSVKTQTIDAFTNHQLHFHSSELATQDFRMTVTNPVTASVLRDNGFVSSTGPGRFVRYTNSTNTYLFPTGWNDNGNILYRPVEFTPTVNDPQSYEVRMGFGLASNEGYDTSIHAADVIKINGKFWHMLKQVGTTTPTELSIYHNTAADGYWGSIGRWQNVPQWEDLKQTTFTAGQPLSRRTKADWMDSGDEPHILINVKETEILYNFPNVFNPWSNQPGNNTFHIIDQWDKVELEWLRIFNRWGEPVFDSERDGVLEWDGYYQGKIQPMANYVYLASVKITDTGEIRSNRGNLSLLW